MTLSWDGDLQFTASALDHVSPQVTDAHPRSSTPRSTTFCTCPSQIKHPSFFVGIILRDVKLPVPNHGHVVLAKPSPILFYPISSNEVR